MKNSSYLWLLLLINTGNLLSQSTLDTLIAIGLTNNSGLKQKNLELNKAESALKEARGLFLPQIAFQAEYTYAEGGRTIALPVGDLLNPVYSTLNALTASQAFPQIQNVNEQFLPNDFHDTRIRTTLPIFNSEIIYLNKIRKLNIEGISAEVIVYKRELIRDIKVAYFNYHQSKQAEIIYENAIITLNSNLAITEALIRQEKALPVARLKAQAELLQVETDLGNARNTTKNALAYINFLINRPLDTQIQIKLKPEIPELIIESTNLTGREELIQINSGINQKKGLLKISQARNYPNLGTFFDAGYQGFGYEFDDTQQYYLGGFRLNWNLFSGMQNKQKTNQAKIEIQQLELKYDEITRQLEMQLEITIREFNNKIMQIKSAEKALELAKEEYRLTSLSYKQGASLPIELNESFRKLMTSELQLEILKSQALVSYSKYERASASYNF
jgi:outer membrane protein TolC